MIEFGGEITPTVTPAGREVAPSAVKGNVQGRVAGIDGVDDIVGRWVELIEIKPEMLELGALGGREDPCGAFANRFWGSQPGNR